MRPDFSTRPRPARPSITDVALLATACLVFLIAAWATWRASTRLSEYRAAALEVRRQTKAEREALDKSRRRSQREALAAQAATARAATPAVVLRDLQDLLPADVRLDSITLDYGASLRIVLRVVARSPGAYDRLVDRLAASSRFESLELGAEQRSGEMTSTISASYHEAETP